jgi:hypothetical protein
VPRSQQDLEIAVSKGSARACELIFPASQTSRRDPEGCTEGAPNVSDRGRVPEGVARPPLHFAQEV